MKLVNVGVPNSNPSSLTQKGVLNNYTTASHRVFLPLRREETLQKAAWMLVGLNSVKTKTSTGLFTSSPGEGNYFSPA